MTREKRDYSNGFTGSDFFELLFRSRANQFILLNVLTSKGAWWRGIRIPFLRLGSKVFGWWSRGWIGQVLGLSWAIAIFLKGFRDNLDPEEPGDDWPTYRAGGIPDADSRYP